MQWNWLQDFVEIARTRSFTRAAENRCVTHPAFGRRIRALEEWVGVTLIERSKPITLTAAGTVFLDAASNALETIHSARAQLLETGPTLENSLRIATGRTLASTFFPGWYDAAVQRYGFFTTALTSGTAQQAILLLVSGEVDLLIVYSSPHTRLLIDRGRFDYLSIDHETLVPVSVIDANGRARFQLPNGNEPLPWLAFARKLTLCGVLSRHLADIPNAPILRAVYQSDSYEAILAMAKRGLGLAWLPQRLVQDAVAKGELTMVGNPSWRVRFEIVLYRQRNLPHPVLDILWPILAAEASSGMSPPTTVASQTDAAVADRLAI